MKLLVVGVLFVLLASSSNASFLQAQNQGSSTLEFEAASLRPADKDAYPHARGGPGTDDPGLYHYEGATLQDMIAAAWGLDNSQVTGPAQLRKNAFDLVVRVPEGATRSQFQQMFQHLLIERFELRTQIEKRPLSVNELSLAPSGLKMQLATAKETERTGHRDGLSLDISTHGSQSLITATAEAASVSSLAKLIPRAERLPFVDKTGLQGKYSFKISFSQGDPGVMTESLLSAPDLRTVLKDQLGLSLVTKKILMDVIVVDSFREQPTSN